MIHLSVETSTEILGMALLDDDRVLGEVSLRMVRGASEVLSPALDILLLGREMAVGRIERVSCSSGPGSYTSLRVGYLFSKGLSQSLGVPLTVLSPFDTLARQYREGSQGDLLVVLNARQGQVTAGLFHREPETGILSPDSEFGRSPSPDQGLQTLHPSSILELIPDVPLRIVGPGRVVLDPCISEGGKWIRKEGEDLPPRASMQGILAWERRNLPVDEVGLVYGRAPV
ncbi:MAG: tRNA (adenosine(37)-N6)-threonylcarbamoyltransferase complex dimerization subunit type 1 TsaB [Leptospirales bacterium]